jgi:2-amino-4-hydroxy-6-hydroxymethyldihydropteridine diphosphokinase
MREPVSGKVRPGSQEKADAPERDDCRGFVSVLMGIGSNLGDRGENIRRGLELLGAQADVQVVCVSRLLETDPVGGPPQGRFLNGAAELHTALGPGTLLATLQRVEVAMGRVRSVRNGPRELDLDILLYGDRVVKEGNLEIPHPRMLERAFVMQPLAQIASTRRHPVTGRTLGEHWETLRESCNVTEEAP